MKTKFIVSFLVALLFAGAVSGQKSSRKFIITGSVLDSNQKPLAGAILFIDNKQTKTKTNKKGIYRIKVRRDAQTLSVFTLFNGLGEAKIEGRSLINFTLEAATVSNLNTLPDHPNDETINIGYGSIKKKDLITQVGKIDGVKTNHKAYRDIYDMIRGEIPGVRVNGKNIKIQGPSSINLSNNPLFVVDGFTVDSIDDISPLNVRSIEVLKGSAAAIYGSRGANGVILINLRTGTDKK